ncbi:hypothetical protein [uncultured Brevundimonas sp.]|uniref:hypothetical protein n=1 Tax=uncultured Brevundimonas sp. TaxID=213418 RepID=UPI0030EE12EE
MSDTARKVGMTGWFTGSLFLSTIDIVRLGPRVLVRPKWRSPEPDERSWVSSHRRLSRLGNSLAAVASRGKGVWLILESDWYGFPDGPRWRLVSVKSGGRVRSVIGFNKLPQAWYLPSTNSDF